VALVGAPQEGWTKAEVTPKDGGQREQGHRLLDLRGKAYRDT
jgi:hypothetical protein